MLFNIIYYFSGNALAEFNYMKKRTTHTLIESLKLYEYEEFSDGYRVKLWFHLSRSYGVFDAISRLEDIMLKSRVKRNGNVEDFMVECLNYREIMSALDVHRKLQNPHQVSSN
jgi:hypothetical protein